MSTPAFTGTAAVVEHDGRDRATLERQRRQAAMTDAGPTGAER